MIEKDQQSKLEQEISTVDALEVILRIGNNQQPFVDARGQREISAMEKIMHCLLERGLVQDYRTEADSVDYATYATLTQKGREIYERIKGSADNLLTNRFHVVFPPEKSYSEMFDHKYELAPEDEEEVEELEIDYSHLSRQAEKSARVSKIFNAYLSLLEEGVTYFIEHPDLDPQSVLEKYREDFIGITKKISEEKM